MTRIHAVFLHVLALCALWPAVLPAAELSDPIRVAERLQAVYDGTRSMTARFEQVTKARTTGREKRGQGTLMLLKPGRMRWDYDEPDRQVFVCDGKTVSMYFARENQMLVSPAEQYLQSDVTYAFFAGTGNILRDFEVSGPTEEDLADPTHQLVLAPKTKHPQIETVQLWVDGKTFQVKRIRMTDLFGSITDIAFTEMKMNGPVPAETFVFTPPEGTEIISR